MSTQTDIAKHIFLSEKRVRELINKGVMPTSVGRGGYDLDKCREAYINYLRGLSSGQIKDTNKPEPDDVRDEKIKRRTLETKLRKENYQLSVLEKQYAPLEIITETLLRVSQSLSIRLESFSAQIKRAWPDMPAEAKEEIDNIIAEGANELADLRPDLSDFEGSDHESGSVWLESIDGSP